MRKLMLMWWAGSLASCKISDVSRDGPTPVPTTVTRADLGAPAEAVLCTDLPGTLVISGAGFSPLPVGTLTGSPGLALPTVKLVATSGQETVLAVLKYDQSTGDLTAGVAPDSLAPGVYSIRVENPNGGAGVRENALKLVPPPTIDEVAPSSGVSSTETPVDIMGEGFRTTEDGLAQPKVVLARERGGALFLGGVKLESSTQIGAIVPSGLTPGFYDLTVTNPEGCSATKENAFEVKAPPSIDVCSTVDPAFGWVNARTTIEICASNAGGHGLLSTPEVFILIGAKEIPLRREAYLDPGTPTGKSIMTAVVPSQADDPRVVVGGPYDIRVVNPDGANGLIEKAFKVLPDPPPTILSVNPARGDKSTLVTLTVTGDNFKLPTPPSTTPVLTVSLLASDGAELPCGPATVKQDVVAREDTATCEIILPAVTGGHVVRVRHEDDGALALFSSFAVTDPSRKLGQATSPQSSLNENRRAHGVAMASDDLGNRFLYAVGGEDQEGKALASTEVAAVSRFGDLGPWTLLQSALPDGRSGVALARVGRFIYAIGGSSDGSTPSPNQSVLRAQVLGADTSPILGLPEAKGDGALRGGTYYYRVAAVMAEGTLNPLGESLPSDEDSLRVSDNGAVALSWAMPSGTPSVHHYLIYRSPRPNLLSGSEVLIHETADGATVSYIDKGDPPRVPDKKPMPVGSLGAWVPVAELGTKRFDAAATVVRMSANQVFVYVTGGRKGPGTGDVLASTEGAALSADGSVILSNWRTGPTLLQARAEHVLMPVSNDVADSLPVGTFGIVAAGGTKCARGVGSGGACSGGAGLKSIESAPLGTSGDNVGEPLSWSSGGALAAERVGLAAIVVNDFFYAFNGWGGTGGSFPNASEKSTTTTCTGGSPCVPTFTGFNAATVSFADGVQYRSGLAFFGAYFYFVGGSHDLSAGTTSSVVLRGSY